MIPCFGLENYYELTDVLANGGSLESKLTTLDYYIEHYIFGIPQMFFLIVVIAVLWLIIAAGYMIMGKYG